MINSSNMSISNQNPLKKRLCPKCCEPLKAVTVGNSVGSSSSGKGSRSSAKETSLYNNLKSYKTEYQCIGCRMSYSIEDLNKIEQSYKK